MGTARTIAFTQLICLALISGCGPTSIRDRTSEHESTLVRCARAEDIVVRFWYSVPYGEEPNIAAGPLILLPVSSQDTRLDTRPRWSMYVTLPELRAVIGVLNRSNLNWEESSGARRLVVDPLDLPKLGRERMEVALSCPVGSASTVLAGSQACPFLRNIYYALPDAKARDTMALWGGNVNCIMVSQRPSSPNK